MWTEPVRLPKQLSIAGVWPIAAIGAVEFGIEDEQPIDNFQGVEELQYYIDEGRLKIQVGAQPGLFTSSEELDNFKHKYATKPFDNRHAARR